MEAANDFGVKKAISDNMSVSEPRDSPRTPGGKVGMISEATMLWPERVGALRVGARRRACGLVYSTVTSYCTCLYNHIVECSEKHKK